jgi:hypothetical protein
VLYTEFSVLTRFHRNDAEVERFAGQQAPGLKNFIALPKELLRKFFTVPITKDCSNQAPLQPVDASGNLSLRNQYLLRAEHIHGLLLQTKVGLFWQG